MREPNHKKNRKTKSLKESEYIFRTIFENASDGVILADKESKRFLLGNKRILKDLGYSSEEFMRLGVMDIHPEKDVHRVLDQFEKLIRHELSILSDIPVRRRDGSVYYADISVIPIPLIDRTLVIGFFRDVTERRRMEETLRESDIRLRLHTENSPMAVVEWDSRFIVTRWGGEAEKIFGWSTAETVGKPIMDLNIIYEEDIPIVELTMKRLTDGESRYVVSANRNYTKTRGVIYCEWYNSVLFDAEGKMSSVMSLVLDITERKLSEESLRKSEERFRAALELSLDAFTMLSPVRGSDGTIVDFTWDYVNPEAGRILKYKPEELVGQRLLEILPGNKLNSDLFDRYIHVFESGEPHRYELYYESEGIQGWFRNMAVKVGENIAVSFSDITDRKRAEEELRRHRDYLDSMVMERTLELTSAYERLKQENSIRKKKEAALRLREKELKREQRELDEVNAALRVLLKHREEDKVKMGDDIVSNIKISILPFLKKLETSGLDVRQKEMLSIVRSMLKDITSPFIRTMTSGQVGFTPSELKVASLIREGKTSKDIAELLNVSFNTIITHRSNIRKKTGLSNQKKNLRSYLQSLE